MTAASACASIVAMRKQLLGAIVACGMLSGCSQPAPAPTEPAGAATSAGTPAAPAPKPKAASLDAARQDLEQIPPPAKSRYLAVHTIDAWSNPFLIVGKKNVTLRIYYPDEIAGQGGDSSLPNPMLRPSGARRRELDLRMADLPEALSALPGGAWPYGRVIAVEEDPSTARPDRVAMRRNVEAAIQMLTDLGIVVDEWPNSGVLR
jgi:hypothetical protein